MAQYMLLLFDNEADWFDAPPEEQKRMADEHGKFTEAVVELGGKIVGGEALQPVATATTVRKRADADPLITDGPFIETKEALGGYYIVEAEDLDQAIEFARLVPSGNVEVRPILVFE